MWANQPDLKGVARRLGSFTIPRQCRVQWRKDLQCTAIIYLHAGSLSSRICAKHIANGRRMSEDSTRNPGVLLAELSTSEFVQQETQKNSVDIYCPRPSCRSMIMRADVGTWVERPVDKLKVPTDDLALLTGGTSSGGRAGNETRESGHGKAERKYNVEGDGNDEKDKFIDKRDYNDADREDDDGEAKNESEQGISRFWLLSNMMAFENIGFSTTVGTVKYLSCADCDVGPLGYHDTAVQSEFLIAADRVRYARSKE